MKFSASVFLLILGPYSFIKTVLSLNCYVTTDDSVEAASNCELEVRRKMSNDDSKDKRISYYFDCVRKGIVEQKDSSCDPQHTECATAYIDLKDQTQFIIKACGKRGDGECDELRSGIAKTYGSFFVTSSHCDYCSSDNCNNQKPKSNPRLSSLSTVSAPPVSASAFIIVSVIHILL